MFRSAMLFSLFVMTSSSALASPWTTVVTDVPSDMEQLAVADLLRYLGQVTDVVPSLKTPSDWDKSPETAVLLKRDSSIHGEGYRITPGQTKGVYAITVAAGTPAGMVNGIYGLLRVLGYRFYLGSESVPESLPDTLPQTEPIEGKSVFSVRGVLPWYNFFNSPTAWDPMDHRAFVDQLIRSGANFVTFHTYDAEPFAAYEVDGKMKEGAPLLNTSSPTWGTSGTRIDQFAFGTDKLFVGPYFGAASTLDGRGPDVAIRREQTILRDAFDYARQRGVHPALGFEITGDPTRPDVRERFIKRLNAVLDFYPMLEYVFLWQAETQGAQGFAEQYNQHILPVSASADSPIQFYGMARRDTFQRVVERTTGARPFFQDNEDGKRARANEGTRLEQFSWLALRQLAKRANAPKLVISGWGGEDRILSAEYYDGLDKLLPKDVVFSSLDFISIRPQVDSVYHALPPDRQRWPIPWMECDGDQWQPQPGVKLLDEMLRGVRQGGSQGVLGIHWRTRDVEEDFGFITGYTWNRDLTAEAFFHDLALHGYGAAVANTMASIHQDLDALGYRWVGGGGQNECAPFSWGPGEPHKVEKLRSLRDRAAEVKPETPQSQERLAWMLGAIDWALAYYDAETTAVQVTKLISTAKSTPDQARELATQARKLLAAGALAKAMRTYARRVTTRGEYGVLATVNTKAAADWRRMWNEAGNILGEPESDPPAPQWNPAPQIVLPRLITSIPPRADLQLEFYVLGGHDAWLHWRAVGENKWISVPCQTVKGWVKSANVPSAQIPKNYGGLQLRFSLSQDPNETKGALDRTITNMGSVKPSYSPIGPAQQPALSTSGEFPLTVKEGQAVAVELSWDQISEADFFTVYRNSQPVCDTAVPFFPDCPPQLDNEYRVEAKHYGETLAASQTVKFTMPDRPVTEEIAPRAFANRSGVILEWDRAATFTVSSFRVARAPKDGPGFTEVGTVRASRSSKHFFHDMPGDGNWVYRLTPLNASGREGKPADTSITFPPPVITPAIQWPLTAVPDGVEVDGGVACTPEGTRFDGGRMTAENKPEAMDMNHAFTLDFTFRTDRTDNMPVLLCHGAWQVDGWFVQILGGSLIVRTPDGDAQGPPIEPGRWYTSRFVFDGVRLRLAINGEWIYEGHGPVRSVPAPRPLVLGGYVDDSAQYRFYGMLRNVTLTQDAVLDLPPKP